MVNGNRSHEQISVLVTGGAGFIGSHVVDRLINEGYNVRVLDDLSTGKLENIQGHVDAGETDFVKGDIRDESTVEKCLDGIDYVAHLAALTSVTSSIKNPDATFDINLLGTLCLIRSSIKRKVRRFVFASSCAVCGEPKALPVNEDDPVNPISPYAESKLLAERYLLGFCERGLLQSVILRFFNVYGPRQGLNEYSGVITRFIDYSRRELPLAIFGDGLQTRDFVYTSDIAEAVSASLKRKGIEGKIFNVSYGKPVSISQLAKLILELTGSKSEIMYKEPRKGDIKYIYGDISKSKVHLDFEPRVSLRDGLRALLDVKRGS